MSLASTAARAPASLEGHAGGAIADKTFRAIRSWLQETAGISLSDQKKALVMGRLAGRLRHYALQSYAEYFELVQGGSHPHEAQVAIDLLTTNETHFFREPRHFDFLQQRILPACNCASRPLRVWCAAASSGEEPYSIAMTLAASLGERAWEVLASDLSTRVLARARTGHYPMARAKTIPRALLHEFCLKGIGSQSGTFVVDPQVRQRVRFEQINLVKPLPSIGPFDVIFLRNVMIYFDLATKQDVVRRMLPLLASGGHLIVGHSESLNGVCDALSAVQPSIYRKA